MFSSVAVRLKLINISHSFSSAAVRSLVASSSRSTSVLLRTPRTTTVEVTRSFASASGTFEDHGKAGHGTDESLTKHGGSAALLKDPMWVNHTSDTVTNAATQTMPLGKGCPLRMPESVLDAAVSAGGDRNKLPDEDLSVLNVTFNDVAYKVVNTWVASLEEGPTVTVMFIPPQNICRTKIYRPSETVFDILREASSIAHYYAPLKADDFNPQKPHYPVVPIPAPLVGPTGRSRVHHARISLHALYTRIQNPNDPNYPVISSLPTGTYICSVNTVWANVIYCVAIYKN